MYSKVAYALIAERKTMEYEDKVQLNRIEAKIDALIVKLAPELIQKPEEEKK